MENNREIYRQKLREYSKGYSMIPMQNNLNQFDKVIEYKENESEIKKEIEKDKENDDISESIIEKIKDFISFYGKYIFAIVLVLILVCILIILLMYITNNYNDNNNSKNDSIVNYDSNDKWSVLINYLEKNNSVEYKDNDRYYEVVLRKSDNNILVNFEQDINTSAVTYMNVLISTSISKDNSIINLNCTSRVKLGNADSYEEGSIKLDISKYDAILSNNLKIKFSTYNISGNKVNGSMISPDSVSGNMMLNIDKYVYDMVSGIDKAIKKISDDVSNNGIEISMRDIGFINYER